MDITMTMVIDPDELAADRVNTRVAKAEQDYTIMVGLIAMGNENEMGNEEIVSQIVGNHPHIFDSLI
eukprot:9230761-Heterocapsa_arctica.AAC.1